VLKVKVLHLILRKIREILKKILSELRYESIIINLGSMYMEAISGFERIIPDETKVKILKGKIGLRKRDLKNWILSIK